MPTTRQFPCITLLLTTLITLTLLLLSSGAALAGDDSPLQTQVRERTAHQNHTQIGIKLQTQTRARLGDTTGSPSTVMPALGDQDRTRDRDGDQTRLQGRLRIRDCDVWATPLLSLWVLTALRQ